ncbi:unnamed protein product [Sphagnum jensenii]|uniref:Uncharacterized protein n=1 Tax=Sphagnum jensenii TaxID=128206 RepID=A0ABP0XJR9_9BRYO
MDLVKELGIYFTDCPALVKRLEQLFENYWTLTTLNASLFTKTVDDKEWQINQTVPCWSPLPAYLSHPESARLSIPGRPKFLFCGVEYTGLARTSRWSSCWCITSLHLYGSS